MLYILCLLITAAREWLKIPVPHKRELHNEDHIHGACGLIITAKKSGIFCSIEPIFTKKPQRDSNIGKSSRLSSITEDMKPQIWENFPKDIFEVVLARLPLATIFRFRIVCRQWHNLLSSQSFYWHFTQVLQANIVARFAIRFGTRFATLEELGTRGV
jgi:hypothetical protein